MSWHGNWSTSSGKGWRRDSWNSSGSGRWTHSGDSQPSWGKGNGESWNNSWDRGTLLPGPPQPSWIATVAANSVESAVTSSISRSLRDAATSWVQSFFSRVIGGSGTSSSLPAATPESHPGPVAAPAMTKESDREVCDDVICVAQRLIMEVRKAAAADGRITPTPKVGKKKLPRRSYFKVPSSDSSGEEVLRKRHCGKAVAHPVTLPLMRPSVGIHIFSLGSGDPGLCIRLIALSVALVSHVARGCILVVPLKTSPIVIGALTADSCPL